MLSLLPLLLKKLLKLLKLKLQLILLQKKKLKHKFISEDA
jgi:hypothetical protein